MMTCPYCGSDDLYDLVVMEQYDPVAHVCAPCGRRFPAVSERPAPHLGPVADQPRIPTPDDLLRGAGLAHLAAPA